ncbi:MAG TPA: nucleotide disphospho-sugar-binding domain-containing protein [Silvibacterium sp.]|nr:nucleotide disphospho-sugar-binding domain-containing protein [Silvibacterium sp.]
MTATAVQPKRILIATIGSLGDLHPCLALALELQRRGHHVTLASTPFYRPKVEALGLAFHGIRPAWDPSDADLVSLCEELKRGPEILFRKIVLPHLRETYDDLLSAATQADFMLAGEIIFPAPLIAEKLWLPWASVILSPASFLSSDDPPILVNAPWLFHVRRAGAPVHRALLNLGRIGTSHWWNPVRDLRREIGLRPHCDPVFRDKFSPSLVLALFSRVLAKIQPDWPPQTTQPGFVFFDRSKPDPENEAKLASFLAAGAPPIVFTLGSTAVANPGNFFHASTQAAALLDRRAILIGAHDHNSSETILSLPYAPYSKVFPHAAAIVHQGGSGTTAQALRAGRPMLIVPYGWDQPDNGARVRRLGAGLTLARANYSAASAAAAIRRLLTTSSFLRSAEAAAAQIAAENALARACDAIESALQHAYR